MVGYSKACTFVEKGNNVQIKNVNQWYPQKRRNDGDEYNEYLLKKRRDIHTRHFNVYSGVSLNNHNVPFNFILLII